MKKKRIAVLVDNNCIRDNRVIKSSEAMAAAGYEVRVFCRDKRKSIGDSKINGVNYERNLVSTLYYSQNIKSQWISLKLLLFKMPGSFFAKFNFCLTAFLLIVAYLTKYTVDFVRKRYKTSVKAHNKKLTNINKEGTRRVKRLRKLKRVFFEYPVRICTKFSIWFAKFSWFTSLFFIVFFIGIISFIPMLLLSFLVGFSLTYVLIDRWLQSLGQPSLNVAQRKVETINKSAPKKSKRLHAYLLELLLRDKSDEAYVYRITKFRSARIYESVRERIIAFAPDLIHAHDLVNVPVGVFLAEDTSAKLIYDAHELETDRDKPSHRRWKKEIKVFEGFFAKKADAIITVSHGLAKEIKRVHGVSLPVVIYNTPDISVAETAPTKLRDDIGVSKDTPLGLYVGGLKITRGLPFFLEAVAQIPDLHFVVCGPRTAKAEVDFINLVKQLGIADRFHMVGPMEQKFLLDYIQTSDFSVIPTQNIGLSYIYALPNKFFESMMANIPILIGREIIEMAELVKQRSLGALVEQENPEDIAKVIRDVIKRSDKISSKIASQKLNDEFGWLAQVTRLNKLYADLLK